MTLGCTLHGFLTHETPCTPLPIPADYPNPCQGCGFLAGTGIGHRKVRGLYLAPHIPGGLRQSPDDFSESTWSPGAFFLAGSTAKLPCIIHLDFTWTPGGLQMNHMESVKSTCQIAVWILPGLNPGSIHQQSRRSLFSSEFILLYI